MELTPLIREIMMTFLVVFFVGMIYYCTIFSDKDELKPNKN